MDEHNAEEEMEIAENVPLLQNAYTIFKNTMNNHWNESSEGNTKSHRKKLFVTKRNFLSHEETSCHKNKLTSGDRKKSPSTIRNLLSQEEISRYSKKPPITGRNFLSHKEAFKD
jgi:hypothetical protein